MKANDILYSIPIQDLKGTAEFKEADVVKIKGKESLSSEEIRYVMSTIVAMRVAMYILDRLGLLHHPIITKSNVYIKDTAHREEFLDSVLRGLRTLKFKKNRIPLRKKDRMLSDFKKLMMYQVSKNNRSSLSKQLKRLMDY
uniref:Uncharacterized protein n=1 Tax=Dikerogammarus haemobaphes virus 1 TaxID=2704946 RepID=A0A6G9HED7_9VIRU|nr:hypothetical protein [Dikerogammarus haemobaphes virus 1]